MIHRVHGTTTAELNRVLELIQKQVLNLTQNQSSPGQVSTPTSGGGASGTPGARGAQGPAGEDGGIDPTLMLMSFTEEEEIIMENGLVVTDESGFAITETHVDWEVVTDEDGIMLTAD